MTDIILYHDTVASSDVILRDTTVASSTIGIPIDFGGSTLRPRQVYYQAFFVPLYVAVVAPTVPDCAWAAPLSIAVPVAKAQVGYSFVPFNTRQLSVNFDNFGWYQALSTPSPVTKAQAGYSFVPFDTRQLSVNFTPFGWLSQPPNAAPVAKAQPGYSFVPFNTAQLSVNFTNFGWFEALSPAPAVAKAQQGNSFVPYNTAQLSVNYTNFGWYEALSPAPAVAKPRQGDAFVPYNTAQVAASTIAGMAWFNPLGSVPASVVYAPQQFAFQPSLVGEVTTTPAVATDDVGGDYSLIPLYRRKKHLRDELEEIELKLRDIALDIPLPGHSFPVIYDRPLLEPFSDKQQTIKVLVSRRARAQAEYNRMVKAQQDDDDDSAILLLWP